MNQHKSATHTRTTSTLVSRGFFQIAVGAFALSSAACVLGSSSSNVDPNSGNNNLGAGDTGTGTDAATTTPGPTCTDTSADRNNCGACGNVCAKDTSGHGVDVCFMGKCGFNCDSTHVRDAKGVCVPRDQCGNGVIDISENCDDSNAVNGDGCNASCKVETGYECIGIGATSCKPICTGGAVCGTWRPVTAPASLATTTLFAVAGTAASDVWVAGDKGTLVHYDGSAWATATAGTTQGLRSLSARTASDVWAVGGGGTALHYNGSAWSATATGVSEGLMSVHAIAANDVWAVGFSGTAIHYNGSAWSTVALGTTLHLLGVWGSASNDLWISGQSSTLKHFDGTTWTDESRRHGAFDKVYGNSATDVWAFGAFGVIDHFDGTAWTNVNARSRSLVTGLWGQSPTDAWFTVSSGTGGTGYIQHTDGADSSLTGGYTQTGGLYGIWGASRTDIWAVGETGTLVHFTP